MTLKVVRNIYRVLRSVLFTAVITIVAVYIGLYILLSIPPVQERIKQKAEKELSKLFGGQLSIASVDIFPFNEVRLKEVTLRSPEGEKCISIGTLGAGIHLWRLIASQDIEITYAEILDLDAKLSQKKKDGPLNIQFLIDALKPKDKNKPPAKFDLQIHNIVIRRSRLSFDRLWMPEYKDGKNKEEFNLNHIKITDLKADITLPRIKNDDFMIDLRRLAFKTDGFIDVDRLSLKAHITEKNLSVNDIILNFGESGVKIDDISLDYSGYDRIMASLETGNHSIGISGTGIVPADFRCFFPPLEELGNSLDFSLKINGNINGFFIPQFHINIFPNELDIDFIGNMNNIKDIAQIEAEIESFNLSASSEFVAKLPRLLGRTGVKNNAKFKEIITNVGKLDLLLSGKYSGIRKSISTEASISTGLGSIDLTAEGAIHSIKDFSGEYFVETQDLNLGRLLNNPLLGEVAMRAEGNAKSQRGELSGELDAVVDYFDFKGVRLSDISLQAVKDGENITGMLDVNDRFISLDMNVDMKMARELSALTLNCNIDRLYPSVFGIMDKYDGYLVSGTLSADLTGNNIDNVVGEVRVDDLSCRDNRGKSWKINEILVGFKNYYDDSDLIEDPKDLKTHNKSNNQRRISVDTDFLNASLDGRFRINDLIFGVEDLLHNNVTTLIPYKGGKYDASTFAKLNVRWKADREIPGVIKLPVKPLNDIILSSIVNLEEGLIKLDIEAPYILKGTNKLITRSGMHVDVSRNSGASLNFNTTFPIKNDRANLEFTGWIRNDMASVDLGWNMVNNRLAKGKIGLDGRVNKNSFNGHPEFSLNINPSEFQLGSSVWQIDSASVYYSDRHLDVDGLRIWHDRQFLEIEGAASADVDDRINIRLADIDLEYIFGLLNINYVTFGGIATGEIEASSVFTKLPVARTRSLTVKELSYNDAVLGDAEIRSNWNHQEKEIEIHADIEESGIGGAKVDGGIFVTRDSLSFDMEADKVNIEFLKPFMSAFTSDVGGRASGKVKLFGNFKDIDLTGRAFADSIYMKVDYTNVYYHGSDSVILNPGRIVIPSFRLNDKFGNSAIFSGVVRHRYFHDPEFEFKLTDAKHLLCYDTNSSINPDWYGTMFCSGNGSLWGRPGIVALEMDMTTDEKSEFTFVLSETQTAIDYSFLTFSDKKKEAEKTEIVVEESIEDKFLKKKIETSGSPTVFTMDLRATVNPKAKMNLIMDPAAGDKITAIGSGPLQIHYDTESDEMKMYGKYTLAEGNYNFSLQELILRDFKIREGSTIAFNGDPMAALIDIVAAYRVNTNLSDLDKNFSNDRDLNRTNVPVDALLKVRGDLQSPEISFDISLPTLTSDVERKVRSIISTEDQMSRQIIYLLALNRFYTPEYMGSTSNGGELASVASSTLSSQLSNIMGQLTDKVTLSPSFRSDKGDFSDMEVDLSLSSRLLNNRLLINGNFGYRDRSTSQTTFVGDFDIEYLLSKNGNLRLKAYNHFNDQNYFLKSSLTTQGLGIVYRKEFDNPFSWLQRKRKQEESEDDNDLEVRPNIFSTDSLAKEKIE